MNIQVRPDRTLVRVDGNSERFVAITIDAPSATRRSQRDPIDVAFVLDRSGSMSGEKIVLARDAIAHAVTLLDERDRFAIVSFDNEVDVVAASAPAGATARAGALERLARIDARGSTDLGAGWLRGCEQVAAHLVDTAIGRVLLMTDGLTNQGITDHDELARHATNLRERGIRTSTFGIGHDYDERLLGRLADAGGGRYYFIARAADIPDRITSEIGESLDVTAREARLDVEADPGVQLELLNALQARADGQRLSVRLGDLVSGQQLELVVKLVFPAGRAGDRVTVRFRIADGDGSQAEAAHEWTFADHTANDRQARATDVDEAVGTIYAARARNEALERNRRGDFDGARRVLDGTRRRIAAYAGASPTLQGQIRGLREEAADLQAPLSASDMKVRHAASYQALRSRDATGKSRR